MGRSMQFDKKPSMTYIYVTDKASEGQMVVNLRRLAPLKRKHKLYYAGLEVLVQRGKSSYQRGQDFSLATLGFSHQGKKS